MTSPKIPWRRLGELLVEAGNVTPAEIERAIDLQQRHGGRLGEVLVRLGAVSEETLCAALARQSGLGLLPADFVPPADALQTGLARSGKTPSWWARHGAIAWVAEDGSLQIGARDPWLADLRESVAASGLPVGAWHYALPLALERWHLAAGTATTPDDEARSLRELAEDAPVVSYVNGLLAQAVEARASDVHVEPGEREFEVRFRIDGVLHTVQAQSMSRYAAVASRIKLVAGLDIAERRLPQDGRISVRVAGLEMDIRVSSIPAVHGESLVLRLLPKRRDDLALEKLGMASDHLAQFKQWLGWPNGLILVTGPTGSGKSSTLYGALTAMNDLTRKIVTVEDPVELRLPHLVQIQTHADIGLTFARALRSVLRHDPDVIMVGEIRDRETAEIAIQAALTGHLVLATLHTNDALSAVTRLTDMGIEPYLVSAALKAVMAQRLVRMLCQACARPADASVTLDELPGQRGRPVPETSSYRVAVGCPVCQETGFRGRQGVFELVPLDTKLHRLILSQSSLAELRQAARDGGHRTMLQDGMQKVSRGQTTVDELVRACGGSIED